MVFGLLLGSAGASHASSEAVALPSFDTSVYAILGFVLLASLAAIGYGFLIRGRVLALSPGTKKMQEVGEAIRSGAYAYLQKQVRAMLPLVIVLAVLLFLLYRGQYDDRIGLGTALAFLVGVSLSYAAGYIGMNMAVNGNQRTANQALSTYKGALETAFRSGAVAGMMTVGLGLLGATVIFLIYQGDAMKVLVGFGFGGSLAALFMRVGGGIFTKAADVGADLVGKVEAGIPEDDPRNPATIADNVGDNVGDCAGMAADLFETYAVTTVATMLLAAIYFIGDVQATMMQYPLAIGAVCILASIVGTFFVRLGNSTHIMRALYKGLIV
ncbi:MAG: sodium/proton-translocating pyrophosphatase, partial [Armatimonadetes bacterium]|nr:sodium/proton-translocating pyrophosphatase [Armatimonadota bacterium]